MSSSLPASIESRLTELCAAIAEASEIQKARAQAEAFLADDEAVGLYREMMTLGNRLHQLHHAGAEVEDAEIERFESLRDRSDAHPGIQAFQEAQGTLQNVANFVNGFVTKTLERGKVPNHEEVFGSEGCGAGCGCHS